MEVLRQQFLPKQIQVKIMKELHALIMTKCDKLVDNYLPVSAVIRSKQFTFGSRHNTLRKFATGSLHNVKKVYKPLFSYDVALENKIKYKSEMLKGSQIFTLLD